MSTTTPGSAGATGHPPEETFVARYAKESWRVGTAAGVLTTVLGVVLVAWPKATVSVVAVVFGILLLVNGVLQLVRAVAADEAAAGARVLYTLLGILSIIVGLLALRSPFQTVTVLAVLAGLFWLVGGIIELMVVVSDRNRPHRGWAAALAGLSALAGLVVLAYPDITLVALTWLLGLWLITWGLLSTALILWIRHRVKAEGHLS
ncbi:HdeD family acid-resistance protein [Actinomadura gamaensis]|uniref:HdeD family acid-resistance protein n=1 Tax=Actinomadura gamaensis TaxID=1763541 RepID=A0ABV9U106_9ACTN